MFYGWFEGTSDRPEYDPPHNAPCPFCGKPVTPDEDTNYPEVMG